MIDLPAGAAMNDTTDELLNLMADVELREYNRLAGTDAERPGRDASRAGLAAVVAKVRAAERAKVAEEIKTYPYPSGDFIVLGPAIFTDKDGTAICWQGVNYVPQKAEGES